jgi:integrase
MNTSFNFTKRSISALPLPKSGIVTYHDTNKRGLKLRVRSTGTKTFVLYRKVKGRPERITIGRFPDLTVEEARKQADVYNAKIAKGISPNEEKRAIRSEITLEKLFNQYLARYARVHKKSWKEDVAQFNRYLKSWATKKLSSIRKQQIQKLHAEIGDNSGHYAANRLLALLHVLFNKAAEWGWDHPNPARGIKKFKEKSRDRFIQADELPRFFQSLNEEQNTTARDYILISLFTGARRSNVLAMRWEDINLERATWTIPETKTGESHTVPLMPEVIAILKKRRVSLKICPWVFPSNSKSGHLADPKKAWKRILKRAGVEDLRIHDLRRSLGSWQAATGANLSVIGKTLAHKNVSTTSIYARLNIDSVRDSMYKATEAICNAGKIINFNK